MQRDIPDDLKRNDERFPDPLGSLMVANIRFEALLQSSSQFFHPVFVDSLQQVLSAYQGVERVLQGQERCVEDVARAWTEDGGE